MYTQIHRGRNGQCLLHCHTNMTPGSNGIQYWFEICNQIDGEFPMNRDNIIYIYGEDGDIRMTDANVIRLAFHILFHFARARVSPPPLLIPTPRYLCVLCDTDEHCCTVILLQCTFQRFHNRRAYWKPIRLKLRLVILTSPANITAIILTFFMKKYVHISPPPSSLHPVNLLFASSRVYKNRLLRGATKSGFCSTEKIQQTLKLHTMLSNGKIRKLNFHLHEFPIFPRWNIPLYRFIPHRGLRTL